MKCELCNRESNEGMYVKLVTGRNKDPLIRTDYSVSTYGDFQPLDLWFCEDCWRVHATKEIKSRWLEGVIVFALGALAVGIQIFAPDVLQGAGACALLGFLMVPAGLFMIIRGVRERAKILKAPQIRIAESKDTPDTIFEMFKPLIPFIVFNHLGQEEACYWKESNWRDWQNKTPNTKVETFYPRKPRENASSEYSENDKQKVMRLIEKNKLQAAVEMCTKLAGDDVNYHSPISPFFLRLKGTILEKMGRTHEALMAYREAVLYGADQIAAEEATRLLASM